MARTKPPFGHRKSAKSGFLSFGKVNMTDTSNSPTSLVRRGAGSAALVGAGLLHLFITPEYLKEKLYIGLLFGLSVPLCLGLALRLWKRDDKRAWLAGSLLCGGMILGFLLSRTVGLPGFDESGVWEHWTEGFPALAAELGFLGLAVGAFLGTPNVTDRGFAERNLQSQAMSSN
jgi:hypothetical protein